MPAVQYPFIDIAVHARVRDRFSKGEAMVLFSADLSRLLWANGAGADLFGHSAVYDLLDQGVNHADITFRQLETAARQLSAIGDSRSFLIRIAKGFQRVQVQAASELIRLSSGENAILFSVPVSSKPLSAGASAAQMLQGLDDPDTHMAVIGAEGEVVAASPGFAELGITDLTAKTLTGLAGAHPDRLVKRPVATGRGYLPAAIGKISDDPALHLLFAVETAIGHLDPIEPQAAREEAPVAIAAAPLFVEEAPIAETAVEETHDEPAAPSGLTEVIDAVSGIEELEDTLEDITGESEPAAETVEAPAPVFVETDNSAETYHEAAPYTPEDIVEQAPPQTFSGFTPVSEADEPATNETQTSFAAAPVSDAPYMPMYSDAPVVAASVDDGTAPAPEFAPAEPAGFVFKPNSRATRFVWKIDAEGRFNEVSHEFADAVGPHAANIIGVAFTDIAALFNLDPDGKLADALAKRDTWSGKTIHWPVEGTSLVVPVDLAALPTYTRNRDFDGFRGFGVVRLSDSAEDPLALGLTLGPNGVGHDVETHDQPSEAVVEQPPVVETVAAEETVAPEMIASPVETTEFVAEPLPAEEVQLEEPVADEVTESPAAEMTDEPQVAEAPTEAEPVEPEPVEPEQRSSFTQEPSYEPPALQISETPNRRLTDKIVQLHGINTGLTAAEQANFREIAKRLEAFGSRVETPAATATPVVPAEDIAEAAPVEKIAADEVSPREAIFESAVGAHAEEPVADGDDDQVTEGLEETVSQISVLTNFIPPRVKMTSGLDAGTVDQLPVAVLVHAGDTLIYANPEFMRLTGYDTLEALGEVGGIDALLQRHELEEKNGRSGTMMLVKADDTLVPVTARLQSVRWEDYNALMLALMPMEDGTAQKTEAARSETRPERMVEKVAKLQIEVEELRSILETATDGVVVIGADGDIRSMNRSASALFNYDEQETRGRPFVMLFAHESQKAVLDYLNGLSHHGVASVLNDGREVIGREAAGGFVPLFMTMGRLTSSDGYCAVIRDITQWKRTEEELRNAKGAAETANAHKTDFLARVSHEIRTPLNAIIGFSDMMAGERFGPIGHPRYVEYANDIGRSGRHVLDIVNDLLDISKIEAGEMDLEFAAVGLNDAIAEAVALVQPQANGQRVIIRTALSQSVPDVVADLRSIKQIALNILSNAIRFTPSGGQIVVSTSYEANGSVVLRVRDTGVGMTRSELDQAMKPFRQVSSTQSRHRGDGTGLGLPLTKAMVDANRAIFSINSAPNEGTLVEITFPSQRVLAG